MTKKELRDYQKKGVKFLNTRQAALLGDTQGLGKTVQAITACKEAGDHRVLVLCPNSVVGTWVEEIETWDKDAAVFALQGSTNSKRKLLIGEYQAGNPQRRYFVTNWETLSVKKQLPFGDVRWSTVIADECFLKDTWIETPYGPQKIQQLQVGDTVWGFDHNTNMPVETRVTHTFKNQTESPLVEVNGRIMTAMHPVWSETRQEYVPAAWLSRFDSMWYTSLRNDEEGVYYGLYKDVRMVREQFRRTAEILIEEAQVLWNKLFGKMAYASTGSSRSNLHTGTTRKDSTDETKEPDNNSRQVGRPSLPKENGNVSVFREEPISEPRSTEKRATSSSKERLRPFNRWERSTVNQTTKNASARAWVEDRVRSTYKKVWGRLSNTLQARPCESTEKDMRGNTRRIPQIQEGPASRQKEERLLGKLWVDGFGFLEQRSIGPNGVCFVGDSKNRTVYNIETESGNYFAEGMLVHNCHAIKNRNAKRTKTLKQITNVGKKKIRKIALTGTPFDKYPDEMWSILNWLDKKRWSSYWAFRETYLETSMRPWGEEITGLRFGGVPLRKDLRPWVLRRTKEDVLKELPKKQWQYFWTDISRLQYDLYEQLTEDFYLEYGEDEEAIVMDASTVLSRYTRFQQLVVSPAVLDPALPDDSPRLDGIVEFVASLAEPVIVVGNYVAAVDLLEARFKKHNVLKDVPVWRYTGSTSNEDREKARKEFQAIPPGENGIIVGTIKAMHLGLTLTRASHMVFVDRAWERMVNEQMEDRIHRMGQTRGANYYIFGIPETVDENRLKAISDKDDNFTRVFPSAVIGKPSKPGKLNVRKGGT